MAYVRIGIIASETLPILKTIYSERKVEKMNGFENMCRIAEEGKSENYKDRVQMWTECEPWSVRRSSLWLKAES